MNCDFKQFNFSAEKQTNFSTEIIVLNSTDNCRSIAYFLQKHATVAQMAGNNKLLDYYCRIVSCFKRQIPFYIYNKSKVALSLCFILMRKNMDLRVRSILTSQEMNF